MQPATPHAEKLVPHLERCGYGPDRLARPFEFDRVTVPVVGFAGKPWDAWSACVAVVERNGDSRTAATQVAGLGAPTVFACSPSGVDWWAIGPEGPKAKREFSWQEIAAAIGAARDALSPTRIYASKLRKPGSRSDQLWFFDAGLMPAVEKSRGEALTRLVERVIGGLAHALAPRLNSRQAQEDVYRTVFWLLAAKILQDKGVDNFVRLNLLDVDEVFARIGRHHGETSRFPPFGKTGRPAIDAAAELIASCGSLADVTSESLAHVYENALIDSAAGSKHQPKAPKQYDIRKELGIHSTPSALVNHMLSQLWPLIEQIAPEDRHVFEPACGHAPFLTAAMRWLRDWDAHADAGVQHRYLKAHLHGIEKDPFAIEIAKLRLLLADAPHGNRWDISQGDMFSGTVLADRAKDARIFLANPPYERADFVTGSRAHGAAKTKSRRKVDEVLARALPNLPAESVIGVVVPQGFLRSAEARELRCRLLADWSLSEIAIFEDRLFEHPDQETAILLGRREAPSSSHTLQYRRVRNVGMHAFKERLAFSAESRVPQSRFALAEACNLALPELEGVWRFLRNAPALGDVATIAKGLELDERSIERNPAAESLKPKPGFEEVVRRAEGDYGIHELPEVTWVDFRRAKIRRRGPEPRNGVPQVLVNYARAGRDRWRLRALLDEKGRVATRRFLVIRPRREAPPLLFLWAVLNSPVGNAFVASHCGERDIPIRVVRKLPLPRLDAIEWTNVCHFADAYLRAARSPEAAPLYGHTPPDATEALRRMDAEVLRLYDLPPRLERELLDYFRGEKRKGVSFEFPDYFPGDFNPYVHLHEFIADTYPESSAGVLSRSFHPVRSEAALAALSLAEKLAAGE